MKIPPHASKPNALSVYKRQNVLRSLLRIQRHPDRKAVEACKGKFLRILRWMISRLSCPVRLRLHPPSMLMICCSRLMIGFAQSILSLYSVTGQWPTTTYFENRSPFSKNASFFKHGCASVPSNVESSCVAGPRAQNEMRRSMMVEGTSEIKLLLKPARNTS